MLQSLRLSRRLRQHLPSRAYHFASPGFDNALARAGVPAWGAEEGAQLRRETVAYLDAFDARVWHDRCEAEVRPSGQWRVPIRHARRRAPSR